MGIIETTPAGALRLLSSTNINLPTNLSVTVTPSGSKVTLRANMMSSYVTAPTGGLFTLATINYDQISYENEDVLVTLCNKGTDKYEFGYNTQMKMNEIVGGVGNWNTAEFWEYATQTATRKNRDPKPVPWESSYAVFRSNPILNSDAKGDYSLIGATWRNVAYNGKGITQNDKGEWGYKYHKANQENGQWVATIGVHYKDPETLTALRTTPQSQREESIRDKISTWLNNTWMNHHGNSYNKRTDNDYQEYGEPLTSQNGGFGAIHSKAKVNGNGFSIDDLALSSGGSPGVGTGVFKLKGINNGIPFRMQVNFSDVSNAGQSLVGGLRNIIDYINGDKPLIEKTGPVVPVSALDTTWDYSRWLWHDRAKYGDTLPVDTNPYMPNPDFKTK